MLAAVPTSSNYGALLLGPGRIEIRDLPLPPSPPAGHVNINVVASGICGSDLHRHHLGSAVFEGKASHADAPVVLGHESAGIVTSVGEGVSTLAVGDRVALEPMAPCFTCRSCRIGKHALCRKGHNVSFLNSPDGFLTQHATIKAAHAIRIPSSMSWDEAACLQPLAIALHTIRRAGLAAHHSISIHGAGPIGLFTAAVAKAYGASPIIVTDISEKRLAVAKRTVATHVVRALSPPSGVSADEWATSEARRILRDAGLDPEYGVDIAVEASSAPSAMRLGVALLRPAGSFLQVGLTNNETPFPLRTAVEKELDVLGVVRYALGDFETAIDLVGRGLIDLKPFVTRRVPLSQTAAAISDLRTADDIKVVIYNNAMAPLPAL